MLVLRPVVHALERPVLRPLAGVGSSAPAAAPTFQAAGVGAAAVVPTVVIPEWPTHEAGDVGLLFIETTPDGNANLNEANGFVEVGTAVTQAGLGTKLRTYIAVATTSSMDAPIIANNNDHAYARILTFRGANPTPNVIGSSVKAPVSTSASAPNVMTTVNNTLIVNVITRHNDSAAAAFSAWTNPNLQSVDERGDDGTAMANGGGIGVATGVLAAAGASGVTTATVTNSLNASLTIALAPAEE